MRAKRGAASVLIIASAAGPIYKLLSALSTFAWVNDTGGRLLNMPGIPPVVDLLAVLIAAIAAYVLLSPTREPNDEIQTQLNRLNEFQRYALRELAKAKVMTGREFALHLQDSGFPVATRMDQQYLEQVFETIATQTNLLGHDPKSGLWELRDPKLRARLLPS